MSLRVAVPDEASTGGILESTPLSAAPISGVLFILGEISRIHPSWCIMPPPASSVKWMGVSGIRSFLLYLIVLYVQSASTASAGTVACMEEDYMPAAP